MIEHRNTIEGKTISNYEYLFFDINTMPWGSFIEAYIRVFNAEGEAEWSESWTHETARELLQGTLLREAIDPIIVGMIESGSNNNIVGFGIGYVMPFNAVSTIEMPYSLTEIEKTKVAEQVRLELHARGCENITFFQEVGIEQEHRDGLDRPVKLFLGVLEAGIKKGSDSVLFWTSKKSRLYPMILAFGGKVFHDFADSDETVMFIEDIKTHLPTLSRALSEIE